MNRINMFSFIFILAACTTNNHLQAMDKQVESKRDFALTQNKPKIDNNILRFFQAISVHQVIPHNTAVDKVAVTAHGHITMQSSNITILNADTGNRVCIRSNSYHNQTMALLTNGTIASSNGKSIQICDPSTGACLQTLTGHNGQVTAITALSAECLATGSEDTTIKIWNLTTGKCTQQLAANKDDGYVASIVFIPADHKIWPNSILASYSHGALHLFDLKTGVKKLSFHPKRTFDPDASPITEGKYPPFFQKIFLLPDNRLITHTASHKSIRSEHWFDMLELWSLNEKYLVSDAKPECILANISCMALMPPGYMVVHAFKSLRKKSPHENSISLWDPLSKKFIATILPMSESDNFDLVDVHATDSRIVVATNQHVHIYTLDDNAIATLQKLTPKELQHVQQVIEGIEKLARVTLSKQAPIVKEEDRMKPILLTQNLTERFDLLPKVIQACLLTHYQLVMPEKTVNSEDSPKESSCVIA